MLCKAGETSVYYKKETHRKGGGGVRYSEADIQEFINDNDVKFIKFSFCDVFGSQKIISVLPSVLPRAFAQGIAVDASRIEGFYKPGDSELFLFPDTDTISLLPWRPSHGRVARFYCHIKDEAGQEFAQDGRKILRDAVAYAKERGVKVNFGAENDFYLFRTDEEGEPTDIPFDSAGFLDEAPEDRGEDVRRDICLTMEQMGMSPQHSHHESGHGQNEIDCHYAGPLKTADNVMMFKQIVRAVAMRNGIHASFLPKPLPDQAGSGLHINLSLCMDGRNLFEGDIAPDSIAGSFMAGVLAHSRELTVFTNPLPNSYQRFGCDEAPRYVSWSRQNRSQLVRIPQVKGDNCRMELRSPDPACNPYLAIGLVGVPVFSGYGAGIAKLAGPTGGYLVGYLLMAFIGGLFIEKSKGQPVVSAVGLILGDAACYVLGTAWFVFQMKCELGYALAVCVYPFIVWDLAKIVVACLLGTLLRKRLEQAGVLKLKEAA